MDSTWPRFAKHRGTYGSPRITADLRDEGWHVSENTVAKIMRGQGLVARPKKRRRNTTRPGRGRWRAPDLIGRKFLASKVNSKWYGDGTEIAIDEGKLRAACERTGVRQSMGRLGSALDNAVIESWHSTLEFELRRLEHFTTKAEAYRRVTAWIEQYNHERRHSALGMRWPVDYELTARDEPGPSEQPEKPAA